MKKIFNKKFIITVTIVALLLGSVGVGIFSVFHQPQPAHAAWYTTGGTWNYRKQITFTSDVAKIPSTQSNFPALISITDADLAADAQDDGDDILFTSSDQTTKLSHEIESFNGTTGVLVAWVKIPSLATSGVIYMYYGNATCASQQDVANVWDTNYKAVWHLKETSGGAGAIKDSTSNANNLTDTGSPTLNATGFVGPAVSFDGTNDYLQIVGMSSPGTPLTIEFFAKPNSSTPIGMFDTAPGRSDVARNCPSGNVEWWNTSPAVKLGLSATTWVHLSFVYRFSGTRIIDWYKNGAAQTSGTGSTSTTLAWTNLTFGNINGGGTGWYAGFLDEIRVSNSARSADWIATEYNNQNDPGSFYSLAGEEIGDLVAPSNPTSITGYSDSGKTTEITSGNFYTYPTPYFEWPAAEALGGAHDTTGGTYLAGVAGYYSYFGTSCGVGGANPQISRGVLSDTGGGVHYSADTNVTVPDLTTNNGTYCLRMKTADNSGNVQSDVWEAFIYKYDITNPNPPSFIAANPAGYSAVNSFDFTWPAATDTGGSGIAGYQYKRSNGVDDWSATQVETSKTDIASYQTGENVFLVRSVDNAGNYSSSVQTTYYYSNDVPTKPTGITAIPALSDTNSFAFSWTAPVHARPIVDFGYVINAAPTINNLTWTGSPSTSLAADAFASQQGVNTFYIVAKDDSGAYGVAEANYGTATFTCTTVAPPIPIQVSITDSSNRTIDLWALTIKWSAGVGQNPATFDHYLVEKSLNGVDFSTLATTASTAYIDTGLLNTQTYYYRIKAVDDAGSTSAASSIVSKMPTGKYTTPPTIVSGPNVAIKASEAIISWVASRASTSSIRFGTSESDLSRSQIDPSSKTSQSISIIGLIPGTRYYYQLQSLDEYRDYSSESAYSPTYNFTTLPAPAISNVVISNITLFTADISWQTSTAANQTLSYGTSISYSSSVSETPGSFTTNHSLKLANLAHTTKYHFKISGADIDGNTLTSDDYVLDTLPMPTISSIQYQPDFSGPAPVMVISWLTNVPTTSSVEYTPINVTDAVTYEESQSALVIQHKVSLSNLKDDTEYRFAVSGSDQFGNKVRSDMQILKTNLDTRPPKISNVNVDTSNVGFMEDKARLSVSWQSDEPATSQVEYSRSLSGDNYETMTAEDAGLILNHTVVISGLEPSVPLRLRVISKDKVGNETKSSSSIVVTSQVQQSVLTLIMRVLNNLFGWMKIF